MTKRAGRKAAATKHKPRRAKPVDLGTDLPDDVNTMKGKRKKASSFAEAISRGHRNIGMRRPALEGRLPVDDAGLRKMLTPAVPLPGVLPRGKKAMAMDSTAIAGAFGQGAWMANTFQNFAYVEGYAFMGYPYLSQLAQVAEYRLVSETISTECTRKWIEIKSVSEDAKATDRIAELNKELDRLGTKEAVTTLVLHDGLFGIGHLYIDTGSTDDPLELKTDMGDGGDFTKDKFKTGFLRGLKIVEPIWCYPARYNATDPLADNWYKPDTWFVMAKEIHISRFLSLVSRPVPDIFKPAFAFGGLSLSQMAKPYVDNWLQTRQSVNDLIQAFSTMVLSTDMEALLMAGGDELSKRIEVFNTYRNNRGVMVLSKDDEQFENVATPLGTLDKLQAQALEHICVAGDTLVETRRGQVPIHSVTVGDEVMTRAGFAPLAWAGQTGQADSLIEITTESSTIRVTECHPIFVPAINEFVAARNVRPSDLLAESPSWGSTAHPSRGAGAGGVKQKPAITATSAVAAFCTAKFGRLTAALSQAASMFTIETAIQTTTTGAKISSQSLTGNTCPNTPVPDALASIDLLGAIGRFASTVAARFEQCFRSARNIAGLRAKPLRGRVVSVRRVPANEPVYNLTIADGYLPEFYANGLLTHNCSVSRIPLVKYTGITPGGLNASSADEIRVFYDSIHAYQEANIRKPLTVVFRLAQLSLWGAVDDDLTFDFQPLWELDEKSLAEIKKLEMETDEIAVGAGIIDPVESRQRIADDPDQSYGPIDPEKVPEPVLEPGKITEKITDEDGEGATKELEDA